MTIQRKLYKANLYFTLSSAVILLLTGFIFLSKGILDIEDTPEKWFISGIGVFFLLFGMYYWRKGKNAQ